MERGISLINFVFIILKQYASVDLHVDEPDGVIDWYNVSVLMCKTLSTTHTAIQTQNHPGGKDVIDLVQRLDGTQLIGARYA